MKAHGPFYCVLQVLSLTNLANLREETVLSEDNIQNVHYIPHYDTDYLDQTRHMNCSPDKVPIYALSSSQKNKTVLVCAKDVTIHDRLCLEYNGGRVQARLLDPDANCEHYKRTPCKSPYQASQSYKLYECFLKLGGIKSDEILYHDLKRTKAELKMFKEMGMEAEIETWKGVAITFIVLFSISFCAIPVMYFYQERRLKNVYLKMFRNGEDSSPFKAYTSGNGHEENRPNVLPEIDLQRCKAKFTKPALTTY